MIARFSLFSREMALMSTQKALEKSAVSISLGVFMALVGVAVAVLGGVRYVEQDRALRHGREGALSTRAALIVTAVVTVIGVILAIDLLRLR